MVYFYLDLVDFYCKCIYKCIYIYIPYMDAMGVEKRGWFDSSRLTTRWLNSWQNFIPDRWRTPCQSLKWSFNHPKKVTKNCQGLKPIWKKNATLLFYANGKSSIQPSLPNAGVFNGDESHDHGRIRKKNTKKNTNPTLLGTFNSNISFSQGTFESMMFLFPRRDMLVSWRVYILYIIYGSKNLGNLGMFHEKTSA